MLQNSLTKLQGVQIILMFVATPPPACHPATVAEKRKCLPTVPTSSKRPTTWTAWTKKPQSWCLFKQHHSDCAWKCSNYTFHIFLLLVCGLSQLFSLCDGKLQWGGLPSNKKYLVTTICPSPLVVKIHVRWKAPKTCHNPGLIFPPTTCPISALSHIISRLSST